MAREPATVLIAYVGSEVSRAAVRHAGELFPGGRAVVATVWEPGLAAPAGLQEGMGMGTVPPDPATVDALDRVQSEHAADVAAEGAALARSAGLAAEPHAVPDEADVADTLIEIARERGAAVVVVGSHGITGLRARLVGGVSRKLLQHCDRPVLVIRGDKSG
jgi:nucleotide-binding universal stress UspA family protein